MIDLTLRTLVMVVEAVHYVRHFISTWCFENKSEKMREDERRTVQFTSVSSGISEDGQLRKCEVSLLKSKPNMQDCSDSLPRGISNRTLNFENKSFSRYSSDPF